MKKHVILLSLPLFYCLLTLSACGSRGNPAVENPSTNKALGQQSTSGSNTNNAAEPSRPASDTKNPNPMTIDANKSYTAVLHTEAGDIEISLNAKQTPITVNNFVTLAKKGYYDNTVFHRAIKGFMIQGGDPKGDGTGGPGYQFDDEPFEGEYARGTLAMANAGPNTNGSQFFIMHQDYPLSKDYVIFGQVAKGLESVDKIAEAPVEMSPMGENSKPVTPVKIKSVDIIEK